MEYMYEQLQQKWQPIIEHSDLPDIQDSHKKSVTAVCLKTQKRASKKDTIGSRQMVFLLRLLQTLLVVVLITTTQY